MILLKAWWLGAVDRAFSTRSVGPVASNPRLRAIRHVVQNEPDGFLLRKDFNAGVSVLREVGLAYDLLIHERQLT